MAKEIMKTLMVEAHQGNKLLKTTERTAGGAAPVQKKSTSTRPTTTGVNMKHQAVLAAKNILDKLRAKNDRTLLQLFETDFFERKDQDMELAAAPDEKGRKGPQRGQASLAYADEEEILAGKVGRDVDGKGTLKPPSLNDIIRLCWAPAAGSGEEMKRPDVDFGGNDLRASGGQQDSRTRVSSTPARASSRPKPPARMIMHNLSEIHDLFSFRTHPAVVDLWRHRCETDREGLVQDTRLGYAFSIWKALKEVRDGVLVGNEMIGGGRSATSSTIGEEILKHLILNGEADRVPLLGNLQLTSEWRRTYDAEHASGQLLQRLEDWHKRLEQVLEQEGSLSSFSFAMPSSAAPDEE
ncbi:unnamed protein product, partial [Amoebophrya sp. A120]|eukprot:GSA120T00010036001.1